MIYWAKWINIINIKLDQQEKHLLKTQYFFQTEYINLFINIPCSEINHLSFKKSLLDYLFSYKILISSSNFLNAIRCRLRNNLLPFFKFTILVIRIFSIFLKNFSKNLPWGRSYSFQNPTVFTLFFFCFMS